MNRRNFLKSAGGFAVMAMLPALADKAFAAVNKLEKSKEEWRKLLKPARYRILFEEATEKSHSSPLDKNYDKGTYICAACYLPLFSSEQKFDSGTGWPSFWQPIKPDHIGTRRDFKLFLPRTEYHCNRCGGHQGHVFDDGPEPTGLRYCNNGLALRFVAADDKLPESRD